MSFVQVTGAGAVLVLESGAVIQNANSSGTLLGVGANSGTGKDDNGTIIMNKGIIKDNKARNAVYVNIGGTFKMNGGTITGNKGNGVRNYQKFDMNGGTIAGNTGDGVNTTNDGGWENPLETNKGIAATFTMTGGVIRGNGVNGVANWNTFTMIGGVIAGNSEKGVYSGGDPFTMFEKTGGVIYGNEDAIPDGLKNNYCAVQLEGREWINNTLWEGNDLSTAP
jgi:hypothetical protein